MLSPPKIDRSGKYPRKQAILRMEIKSVRNVAILK